MDTKILDLEAKGCFDFFWKEANTDKNSPGYGLIRDNTKVREMASIASVGFGLSAIAIGVQRKWITYEAGYERTLGTLKTFLNQVDRLEGFFYHFLEMETGKKFDKSYDCASIIDTSLFLNGAITSAEYFGGEVKELFEAIFKRVNWQVYYDVQNNWYYMGYNAVNNERGAGSKKGGGFGAWDMYAEQLMQYILGVSSPTHAVPSKIYKGFARDLVSYGDYQFYNCPGGSLFTHQFSHAWYDFQAVVDKDGINWFDNSVKATLAQQQYCTDNPKNFKTYGAHSWGVTACQGPFGYKAYGLPPFAPKVNDEQDGTIAPAASAGSIIFTPKESIAAMNYFYDNVPQLWSKYGFLDAYNLDVAAPWVADRVIGIDKGITLLMIDNYQNDGFIQKLYMSNEYVKKGADLLGWQKAKGAN